VKAPEGCGKNGQGEISGTRNLKDNISDLKAQVAANQKGIHLVQELIAEYSLTVVQAYMRFGMYLTILIYQISNYNNYIKGIFNYNIK
jgi:hypothetical protein